jgi:hypothetical protein
MLISIWRTKEPDLKVLALLRRWRLNYVIPISPGPLQVDAPLPMGWVAVP